jgi:hypothetical protein
MKIDCYNYKVLGYNADQYAEPEKKRGAARRSKPEEEKMLRERRKDS